MSTLKPENILSSRVNIVFDKQYSSIYMFTTICNNESLLESVINEAKKTKIYRTHLNCNQICLRVHFALFLIDYTQKNTKNH